MTKQQHQLAIELLERLGVDHLQLEPDAHGKYRYHGWSLPLTSGNGSPTRAKRGRIGMNRRSRRFAKGSELE